MAAAPEMSVRLSKNRQQERTEFKRVEELDFPISFEAA
jgi:hypothetical protein